MVKFKLNIRCSAHLTWNGIAIWQSSEWGKVTWKQNHWKSIRTEMIDVEMMNLCVRRRKFPPSLSAEKALQTHISRNAIDIPREFIRRIMKLFPFDTGKFFSVEKRIFCWHYCKKIRSPLGWNARRPPLLRVINVLTLSNELFFDFYIA